MSRSYRVILLSIGVVVLGPLGVGHCIMPTFQRRCQSWVGSSLHSVRKSSSYLLGGSSIVYALASTVSPKRRRGVLRFFAGFQ